MAPNPPNIVLINCDDLGYGDLGCYGSRINKTPNLDRLAEEGTRFTDYYVASAVCSPSRGAMLTGCYPRRIGFGSFENRWVLFPGQPVGLSSDEVTIADSLKAEGYATKIVGKWHCGDQPEFLPTRHGFDSYYGLPYSNDMGRQPSRSEYPPLPLLADEEVIQEQPDQTSLTERYVEQCIRFIRENKKGPFFLYLAHMYVHLPLYAPKRFLDQAENGAYGAAVECIDWAAGVVLNELRKLSLDENTLVMFTSDNGSNGRNGGSNAPLRGAKGSTWEGGQRVPFIARWPETVPAGRICSEIVSSIDFLPTFTALTGSQAPSKHKIDGLDFSQLLLGDSNTGPRTDFLYYFQDNLEAARSGKWKLHVRKRDEEVLELYDLESDIGETQDVSAAEKGVVAELQELMDTWRADLGDHAKGMDGSGCRPCGKVMNAKPLTQYDPDHPYIVAMYDKDDIG